MNNKISPRLSAELAELVYSIRQSNSINESNLSVEFEKDFILIDQSIKGVSGGIVNKVLNRKTGFAFTAQGHSKAFKDHHIIAIRGTHFPSASDWLTNFNVSTSVGPKNIEAI
jgi:triacylglycerol lipase